MHEPLLEYAFPHQRVFAGDRVQGRELRLHVGRETGPGRGYQVDRMRPASLHVQLHETFAAADLGARVPEGPNDLAQGQFATEPGDDAPSGHGAGNQVGASLDAVGENRAAGAMQPLHAPDGNARTAGPGNPCAHRVEAVGQITHFRFPGGILDNRLALCQNRGHQDILGPGYRGQGQIDASPL